MPVIGEVVDVGVTVALTVTAWPYCGLLPAGAVCAVVSVVEIRTLPVPVSVISGWCALTALEVNV